MAAEAFKILILLNTMLCYYCIHPIPTITINGHQRPTKTQLSITKELETHREPVTSLKLRAITLTDPDISKLCDFFNGFYILKSLWSLEFDTVSSIPRLNKTFFIRCNLAKFTIRAPDDIYATEITENAFEGATSLIHLEIERMPMVFQLSKVFTRGLSQLRELLLTHGYLTYVESDAFDAMTSLRVLNLEFNRIQTLENGVFQNLDDLEVLNLRGNRLKIISFGFLEGARFLTTLHVDLNDTRVVTPQNLRPYVPSLEHVVVYTESCLSNSNSGSKFYNVSVYGRNMDACVR